MSWQDWYREHEGPAEEHAVDVEVAARLENTPEYQELRAQVLELGGMLGHLLDGEALDLWLRVESAMNDRWAMFADEAYNVGVDAGLAMRVVDDVLADAGADPNPRCRSGPRRGPMDGRARHALWRAVDRERDDPPATRRRG